MSKTEEKKLRDAANELFPFKHFEKDSEELQNVWIKGAKSKEAAEYHQSLQPVVDLNQAFESDFPEDGPDFVGSLFDIYEKGFRSGEKQKPTLKEKDLLFLKEMQQHAEKAFNEKCVVSKDMLLLMIGDWIHELSHLQPPAPESDLKLAFIAGARAEAGHGKDFVEWLTEYKQSKTNSGK